MSVRPSSLQKSKVFHKIDALASSVLDNHRPLSGRETSIHKIDEIKVNVEICLINCVSSIRRLGVSNLGQFFILQKNFAFIPAYLQCILLHARSKLLLPKKGLLRTSWGHFSIELL